MNQRVLATDRAKVAARQFAAILDGDVLNALRELKYQGQRLSNPAVWDGPNAREFRTNYWPHVQAAIDRTLSQLKQLGTSSQHVIAEIIQAGSVGGGVALAGAGHNASDWKSWLHDKKAASWAGRLAWTKTAQYVKWLGNVGNDAVKAEQALQKFKFGSTDIPLLSKLSAGTKLEGLVSKAGVVKGVGGKLFLPLTMVSGLVDVVTGGGYSGWRGITDRVMGGIGAGGAGALLFAGALGLGPVGIGIAGAAVLAYGAWSLGNVIWDNREAIGHAMSAAWNATSHFVDNVASGIANTAKNIITSPLKLIPHFSIF